MGSSPSAHIAYGYALGSNERLDVRERIGDYGSDLGVDWWVSYDPDGDDDQDVPAVDTQIYRRLFAAIPDASAAESEWEVKDRVKDHYGVELAIPGAEPSTGYALVAAASEQRVDWDEVMTLDVADLRDRPFVAQWHPKIANALTALGITPIQDGPKWLVFPTYG